MDQTVVEHCCGNTLIRNLCGDYDSTWCKPFSLRLAFKNGEALRCASAVLLLRTALNQFQDFDPK